MNDENEENKLMNLIDLSLDELEKSSDYWIEYLELQIKICRNEIEYLKNKKILWFKKYQTKKNAEKIKVLEEKILKYKEKIQKELSKISD